MDVFTQLNSALAGRYLIERRIGQGGMAMVYLARDLRHERKVALKVLSPELGAVVGKERFLAEIRVTANLQHPHLLPLFDSGEAEGQLFYVMPFVQGESLRDRLHREKQLPIDEAVRIAAAVGGALDYAHRHRVIHRDLNRRTFFSRKASRSSLALAAPQGVTSLSRRLCRGDALPGGRGDALPRTTRNTLQEHADAATTLFAPEARESLAPSNKKSAVGVSACTCRVLRVEARQLRARLADTV